MSKDKFCPFIKSLLATEYGAGMSLVSRYDECPSMCLKDKCQMWRVDKEPFGPAESARIVAEYCGIAGRP